MNSEEDLIHSAFGGVFQIVHEGEQEVVIDEAEHQRSETLHLLGYTVPVPVAEKF